MDVGRDQFASVTRAKLKENDFAATIDSTDPTSRINRQFFLRIVQPTCNTLSFYYYNETLSGRKKLVGRFFLHTRSEFIVFLRQSFSMTVEMMKSNETGKQHFCIFSLLTGIIVHGKMGMCQSKRLYRLDRTDDNKINNYKTCMRIIK